MKLNYFDLQSYSILKLFFFKPSVRILSLDATQIGPFINSYASTSINEQDLKNKLNKTTQTQKQKQTKFESQLKIDPTTFKPPVKLSAIFKPVPTTKATYSTTTRRPKTVPTKRENPIGSYSISQYSKFTESEATYTTANKTRVKSGSSLFFSIFKPET
jgi:hypothetical protein